MANNELSPDDPVTITITRDQLGQIEHVLKAESTRLNLAADSQPLLKDYARETYYLWSTIYRALWK